jgi:uncharacterized alpha-E superfamily protein
MARHIERVDNCARLIDYAHRVALLPDRLEKGRTLSDSWGAALSALGQDEHYARSHGRLSAEGVIRYLIFDADNPGSIHASLHAARESGRAQRGAISAEMYEDINTTWLRVRDFDSEQLDQEGLQQFLDWVKRRAAAFRGVTLGTLVRDEAYVFLSLGTFLERADYTLRLLDLYFGESRQRPAAEVGSAVEYYRLSALLQAISAFETYRKIYRDVVTPARVAELLVLRADLPRSLAACAAVIHRHVEGLAQGRAPELVRQCGALASELRYGRMETLLGQGTSVFLKSVMARLYAISDGVNRTFMMAAERALD